MNATMRPAAGIAGVIAQPLQGAWKSAQSMVAQKQEQQQLSTRISDGIDAVKRSIPREREGILGKYEESKAGAKERRERMKKTVDEMFETAREQETKRQKLEAKGKRASPPSSPSVAKSLSSTAPDVTITDQDTHVKGQAADHDDEDENFIREVEMAKQLSVTHNESVSAEDDDDAFARDLEMAKQLSLAEQRGFERGLAEAHQG